MADKYVDVSLSTGLNDGTSQANAWQSLADVFKNTMASGSLAAGDVVHVRTADGSGNLSEYITANITHAVLGTPDNPVKFIFDPGVKWTEKGEFQYGTITDVNYQIDFAKNGYIDAFTDGVRRLRVVSGFVDSSYFNIAATLKGFIRGVIFDVGTYGLCTSYWRVTDTEEQSVTVVDCYFIPSRIANTTYSYVISLSDFSGLTLINPIFDLTNVSETDINAAAALIYADGDGSGVVVFGGKVINDSGCAALGVYRGSTSEQNVHIARFFGFDKGVLRYINSADSFLKGQSSTSGNQVNNQAHFIGGTHPFDFCTHAFGGTTDFVEDSSWPYLNTTLPDNASQGFSVRYLPPGAGYGSELITAYAVHTLHKIYTQAAATRDVTIELLVDSTYGSPAKNKLWAMIQYENSSGEIVTLSSFDQSGTVATSAASWFNNSYIGRTWNPHKIEFTTPDAIGQDTNISVTVFSTLRRTSDFSYLFVDPDPATT